MKLSHVVLSFGFISLFCALPSFASPSICNAASGNLVLNCGFETGYFTDWAVTGTPSANFGVTTNLPNSGTNDARFGDLTNDYIDQSFATTAGNSYNVSFYVDTTANGGVSSNGDFVADWNGTSFLTLTGATGTGSGPDAAGYEMYSFTETATSATTDLKFGGATADSYYHLDDVVVTPAGTSAVPEPSSVSFLMAGLFGVVLMGRKYIQARS
jgi:hypothetical protein